MTGDQLLPLLVRQCSDNPALLHALAGTCRHANTLVCSDVRKLTLPPGLKLADVHLAVGAARRFPRLQQLEIKGYNKYETDAKPDDSCGVVDLYYLRALTGLTRLDLRHTELTPSSSHHITVLRNLRELDLSGGKQSYGSKSWVNAFRKLKALTKLGLQETYLECDGMCAVALLKQLRCLGVGLNHIFSRGAKALGCMTNLTELVIADNNLESKDCRHLARLTGLERLNALGASIGATGCRHMAALSRLTALNLNGNQDIGDTGAKVIAGSLKQLHVLEVANCYIQIDGAIALAQLPHLERLNLDNAMTPAWIGDEGAQALCALGSTLKYLDVIGNEISARACVQLATSLTNLTELRMLCNGDITRGIVPIGIATVSMVHALCALQGLRNLLISHGGEECEDFREWEAAIQPLVARGVVVYYERPAHRDDDVW